MLFSPRRQRCLWLFMTLSGFPLKLNYSFPCVSTWVCCVHACVRVCVCVPKTTLPVCRKPLVSLVGLFTWMSNCPHLISLTLSSFSCLIVLLTALPCGHVTSSHHLNGDSERWDHAHRRKNHPLKHVKNGGGREPSRRQCCIGHLGRRGAHTWTVNLMWLFNPRA